MADKNPVAIASSENCRARILKKNPSLSSGSAPAKRNNSHGGTRPGAGRPKGIPNQFTQDMRNAVWEAFDRKGGVEYLVFLAEEHPKVFGTMLQKLIPNATEITGESGGTIKVEEVGRSDAARRLLFALELGGSKDGA